MSFPKTVIPGFLHYYEVDFLLLKAIATQTKKCDISLDDLCLIQCREIKWYTDHLRHVLVNITFYFFYWMKVV